MGACVGGAALVNDLEAMLREAGFPRVEIAPRDETKALISQWTGTEEAGDPVLSALITVCKA